MLPKNKQIFCLLPGYSVRIYKGSAHTTYFLSPVLDTHPATIYSPLNFTDKDPRSWNLIHGLQTFSLAMGGYCISLSPPSHWAAPVELTLTEWTDHIFISQVDSKFKNRFNWQWMECNCLPVLAQDSPDPNSQLHSSCSFLAELFIYSTNIWAPTATWSILHSISTHKGLTFAQFYVYKSHESY